MMSDAPFVVSDLCKDLRFKRHPMVAKEVRELGTTPLFRLCFPLGTVLAVFVRSTWSLSDEPFELSGCFNAMWSLPKAIALSTDPSST